MAMRHPSYVDERELGYHRIRRTYAAGESVVLDQSYRLAHLPLVAPTHQDAIHRAPDGSYVDGRYGDPRFSLVLPVEAVRLESSLAFRKLDQAVRGSRFAGKIAWAVMRQRRHHLHVTVCGGLAAAELGMVAQAVGRCLAEVGPIRVRIAAPLMGEKNVGRVYFGTYPEQRAGQNLFHAIQQAAGRTLTDLYLLGYYNLTDHLDVPETAEFAAILGNEAWQDIMTFSASRLWIMQTNDDLALSGVVREDITCQDVAASRRRR